jgi:tRNA dimethylallyltransferase
MMENGLLDEARNVCCADWFLDSTASQAIGYKEFFDYFNSDKPLSECVELLKQHSRNYAKRQLTWFKSKKVCDFIDISDEEFSEEELIKMIERKY